VNDAPEPLLVGGTAALRGYLVPLRRPDFRLLVGGQMLSTFGDMLFLVALPFIVLGSGDAADLTVMLTLLGVARMVGAPLGGLLSDRWDPRSVMVLADVARAVVLVALVAVGATGDLLLFGIGVAVIGGLDGLFLPAYWAVMPTLLEEDELAAGNAVGEGLLVSTVMVGTLVGGLTSSVVGPTAVLAVNAVTFALSAVTVLKMRARPAPKSAVDAAGPGFWTFMRGARLVVAITLLAGVLHLTSAGITTVALPVHVDERFTGGQRVFGLLLSAQGVGLLLGTLAAGLLWKLSRRGYLAVGLLVVHGAVLAVFPRLPGLVAPMAAMVVLGLVAGVLGILAVTILQQSSPPSIRGRVMAAFTAVTLGAYPISSVVIGVIVIGPGAGSAFLFSGLGVLVAAAIGLSQRALREA
jgi:predicted MFS family arabinose efflux permease